MQKDYPGISQRIFGFIVRFHVCFFAKTGSEDRHFHFGVQNRSQRAPHIDMPTRYETLPLTSLISIPFERASVIRDIQFLLKKHMVFIHF